MTPAPVALRIASESLERLAPEWAALCRSLPRPLPFDTPEWHRVWWSAFGGGRQPLYLAIRDGERLVGVAPLLRDGDTLATAGDPDLCDLASFPITAEPAERLLPGLFEAIDDLSWRSIHVWGLPEDADALSAARAWAAIRGYGFRDAEEAVCPRLTPASDWESHLAALPKKDRQELKRKLRRFSDAGERVELRLLTKPDAIAAALPVFFTLHRVSRPDKAAFMTEAMEAFFREVALSLAKEGRTRLYLVDLDGRTVAALLAFRSGDELLLYNSGYDPTLGHVSVGIASKALVARAAFDEGLTAVDFLRGAEPYKYDLGAVDRRVYQLWITRNE